MGLTASSSFNAGGWMPEKAPCSSVVVVGGNVWDEVAGGRAGAGAEAGRAHRRAQAKPSHLNPINQSDHVTIYLRVDEEGDGDVRREVPPEEPAQRARHAPVRAGRGEEGRGHRRVGYGARRRRVG